MDKKQEEVEVMETEIIVDENYKKIIQANASIRTMDIKGKNYAEVNQRIKAFRQVYPLGTIKTDIEKLDFQFERDDKENDKQYRVVIMKTTVMDKDGTILGTGFAYEKEGSTFINKTSYIENCETSAVGRALGMCGFGIETSVCSYEELQNALNNQKKEPEEPKELSGKKATEQQIIMIKDLYSEEQINKMLANLKVNSLEELAIEQASEMVQYKR
jgi:hypothetical protein